MRTVLVGINGSYAHSNLAIRCLRDALGRAGFAAELLEGPLRDRPDALLARLVAAEADLYGFSCYIWNIEQILRLVRELRVLRPHCRIVLGGPEASYDTERFFGDGAVDTVITGEGEVAIVELARAAKKGEPLPRVLVGKPDPDFTSAGIRYKETEPVTPLVYYESSRGCPFSCAFCLSSAAEGVRAKSAEDTLADLLAFEKFREPLTVKLVDRTFNFDRERAKKIWRGLLSKAFTKCYHFEISASLLDEECYEILAQFPKDKVRLEIGLQTANPRTLADIGRHIRADEVLAASRRLTAPGNLHIHLDLIAGLPHESLTDIAASFDAAYDACDVLQLGFLKLLRGTRMRAEAEALGIRYSPISPYTVLETDKLSFAELQELHRVAELLERVRDSGRFAAALDFIRPYLPSPFLFYSGLAAYLAKNEPRPTEKLPQRALYVHLALYGDGFLPDAAARAAWRGALRRDFAAAEVRRPPQELLS